MYSQDDETNILKIDKYLFLNDKVELEKTAFSDLFSKYKISGNGMDIPNYLSYIKKDVFYPIEDHLIEGNIKVQIILNVLTYVGNYGEENYREDNTYLHSITKLITWSTDLDEWYDKEVTDHILESFSSYEGKGSGWKFMGIQYLEILITKVKHFGGSSYIELPLEIKNKKACVNVQNNNQECFKFSILAALHYDEIKKNYFRPSKYTKWLNDLNFNGIDFPVDLKDIDKFENQNPYRINVLGYENKEIYPLRISNKLSEGVAKSSDELTINLLLINDKNEEIKNEKINNHYVWIKDLSKLLSKQISNNNGKKFICIRCFNYFKFESALKKHKEICKNIDFIKTLIPKEGTFIEFKNYKKMIKVPFVIYADFETINKKRYQCDYCSELFDNEIFKCNCKKKNEINKTKKYQELVPCGFSFYVHSIMPEIKFPVELYRGPDAAKVFCEKIQEYVKDIYYLIKKKNKKIEMTEDQIKKFNSAIQCYICKKEFSCNNYKVRDHCHLTGKYRGPAHNNCNLNLKEKVNFIPIFFHNLAGFDCHLFIRELSESDGNIECLAKNKEDYISFTKKVKVDEYVKNDKKNPVYFNLRFLDSFKFMASSLFCLSKNLNEFPICRNNGLQDRHLRKGIYPYDYMDSFNRFEETENPSKHAYYSILNNQEITDEDYEHSIKIWKEDNIKNLGEYHDLYLKIDVLLLAEIFENFRNVCLKHYELDPAHYYTSPGLSWDALLKFSKQKLELLSDINMIQFIESGIRGGVSMISYRHSIANNKYMMKNYDPDKEIKSINYLDANNLYGWAMCESLPVGNFKIYDDKRLSEDTKAKIIDRLQNWKSNSKKGYIIELDLEYPKELHDLHNSYPLAPEKIKVNKIDKLIPNLYDKKKYICHIKNLQLYVDLGLKIKKIHRILEFDQRPWMKSYIEFNTELRKKATNAFEKDFFKLMNNSVFGKTMENIRNRVDIKLVNNRRKAIELTRKLNYNSWTWFSENLVAIHMNRIKLYFNKPIYIGMSILDISKTLIFEFHYKYMIPKFKENQQLLFTDTDSLCYEIENVDFYKEIKPDINTKFDTSDLDKKNKFGFPLVNKKVLGLMKDEFGGKIALEFVGLRSKMYCLLIDNESEIKKAKGVKKNVIKKEIKIQDYRNALKNINCNKKMNLIRSYKHNVYCETLNKLALSGQDDKRIIDNGINTYAYGHYKVYND